MTNSQWSPEQLEKAKKIIDQLDQGFPVLTAESLRIVSALSKLGLALLQADQIAKNSAEYGFTARDFARLVNIMEGQL